MDLAYIRGISKLEHWCRCAQDSMKNGDMLKMEHGVRLFIRTNHYVHSGLGVDLGMGLTANSWVTGCLQRPIKCFTKHLNYLLFFNVVLTSFNKVLAWWYFHPWPTEEAWGLVNQSSSIHWKVWYFPPLIVTNNHQKNRPINLHCKILNREFFHS